MVTSANGNDVIRRPYNKCAGVKGSRSSMLVDKQVSGRSFMMASISIVTVCSVSAVTKALPRVFFRVDFTIPTMRSQNPPYHGALEGMNCQIMPLLFKKFSTSLFCLRRFKIDAADVNVVALSEIISDGSDFRLVKRLNAWRNESVDRSLTISRCIALVVAQVNRHM